MTHFLLSKVGNRAYNLFPDTINIHPVFHVSQLKKHLGKKAIPSPHLPMVNSDGTLKTEPALVLQVRQILRHNLPVVQWLIQWTNLSPEDGTWEDTVSSNTCSQLSSARLPKRGAHHLLQHHEGTLILRGEQCQDN